jgi:hypothetical protein
MEAESCAETLVRAYQTKRLHIKDDWNIHHWHCDSFACHKGRGFVVEEWCKWAKLSQLQFKLCWSGVGGDDQFM